MVFSARNTIHVMNTLSIPPESAFPFMICVQQLPRMPPECRVNAGLGLFSHSKSRSDAILWQIIAFKNGRKPPFFKGQNEFTMENKGQKTAVALGFQPVFAYFILFSRSYSFWSHNPAFMHHTPKPAVNCRFLGFEAMQGRFLVSCIHPAFILTRSAGQLT